MRQALLWAAMPLFGCGGPPATVAPHGAAGHHEVHQHHFDDPAKFATRWEGPERDAWQRPDVVIPALSLTPDSKVADIGAGTGYFAVRLAAAVPQGQVYAVDLEPAMIEWLKKRFAEEGRTHATPVLAAEDDPKLPEPVDVIFLCNTYHHIGGRTAYFKRLHAALRPGGRIAIVDYKPEWSGDGPPAPMRLAADAVIAEMSAAGYRLQSRDDAQLERQYMLVFVPEG